ncbi:MAG: AraC family transcriptional regulator, partial [Alkalibacterium sp.]
LSESYVSHLFKEVTGYTVMEYVMNYRLIQAKAYMGLAPLESTIKECAMACGFESDAHFNRFFKKRTGMTPKQYKNMIVTERK